MPVWSFPTPACLPGDQPEFSAEEIVHIVAFLQTLKGNPPFVPPPEKDAARNPFTRPTILPYYGDNLDPATNPAIVFADNAFVRLVRQGTGRQSLRGLSSGAAGGRP